MSLASVKCAHTLTKSTDKKDKQGLQSQLVVSTIYMAVIMAVIIVPVM